MNILNDHYDFNIAEFYAPAIINGDYSGMDDEEEKRLDAFIAKYSHLKDGTWTIDENDESDFFTRCDVSGLFSSCYKFKLFFTTGL